MAGYNLSKMLVKDDNYIYSNDSEIKNGFHIGSNVGFPISTIFSFETTVNSFNIEFAL